MSIEDNKTIVRRWLAEFWGPDYNPAIRAMREAER